MKLNSMLGTLYDEPLLLEPISKTPIRMSIFSSIPFIGSDGASALDNYPAAKQRISAKYGCPDLPGKVVPGLKERMKNISSKARSYIERRFGTYFASQSDSEYEAAVDAFEPEMMLINGRRVPISQIDAFYSPGNDGIALDAASIYGTEKNRRTIERYKKSINDARKIGGKIGEVLTDFYRGMKRKFEDKNHAVNTITHERMHRVIENSVEKRPADYLSVEQNEGLTCAAADEATGNTTTTKGTTYHSFKMAAYRALHRIGYKSATKYIKDCDAGRTSGRRYIRNFRMAA